MDDAATKRVQTIGGFSAGLNHRSRVLASALAFACLASSIPAIAQEGNCRDMEKAVYERHIGAVEAFFAKSDRFRLDRVDVSAGLDCGGSLTFFIEAKPEYNNSGRHWVVEWEKASGRMTLVDGI